MAGDATLASLDGPSSGRESVSTAASTHLQQKPHDGGCTRPGPLVLRGALPPPRKGRDPPWSLPPHLSPLHSEPLALPSSALPRGPQQPSVPSPQGTQRGLQSMRQKGHSPPHPRLNPPPALRSFFCNSYELGTEATLKIRWQMTQTESPAMWTSWGKWE